MYALEKVFQSNQPKVLIPINSFGNDPSYRVFHTVERSTVKFGLPSIIKNPPNLNANKAYYYLSEDSQNVMYLDHIVTYDYITNPNIENTKTLVLNLGNRYPVILSKLDHNLLNKLRTPRTRFSYTELINFRFVEVKPSFLIDI